jgi:molecular chaperone GrpE
MAKEKQPDIEEQEAQDTVTEETVNDNQTTEKVDNESTENEDVPDHGKLEKQLQSEKDKFLRLFAEFENYKRRTAKERMDLFKTANQEVMLALLPVMDDFDRAIAELKKSEYDNVLSGVNLIHKKFKNTLLQKGLMEMDVEPGETFDAEVHEAVTQIPAPSDDMKGKIVDVVEKGYKLGEKVIRFPKVVIGQ